MARHLLEVDDLQVCFATEEGVVRAVDDVSFTLDRGEVLGVVGESGSGKSVTAMTLLGLTRSPNATIDGEAYLDGLDLITGVGGRAAPRARGKGSHDLPGPDDGAQPGSAGR